MNNNLNVGEVWFVRFPYEENPKKYSDRPVVVLDVDEDQLEVLSVKVTKHNVREYDDYDAPIVYWQQAKLRFESTARVAKTIYIPKDAFIHKFGDLHEDDLLNIQKLFMKYVQEQKNKQ